MSSAMYLIILGIMIGWVADDLIPHRHGVIGPAMKCVAADSERPR